MIFSSYNFIFLFLPITLLFYYLALAIKRPTLARLVLLAASLVFYSLWKIEFLPVFMVSVLCNYAIGQYFQIHKPVAGADGLKHKPWAQALFALGIIGNLALLFYYKYLTFFAGQVNLAFDTNFVVEKIIMPLGISFFTFMQMSYLFESYRGRVKERTSLLDYTLFITFFPHLIAGPIILHKELIPQFHEPERYRINPFKIAVGIFLFTIGLYKKVVIADGLAGVVRDTFDKGATEFIRAWLGALGFTFQLYFDFSGYMDMAMGIALMMNLVLPVNFDSPFRATNISNFWRRWHITMTRFFMSYVFMPLAMAAGRRQADWPVQKQDSTSGRVRAFVEATAVPILLTFILAGIWHGAGWNFIVFGLMHGIALVVHRLWQLTGVKVPKPLAWFLTFMFVVFSFVVFRATNLELALKVINSMIGLKGFWFNWAGIDEMILIAVGFFIIAWPRNSQQLAARFTPSLRYGIAVFALLTFSLVHVARQAEFLYWQF